MAIQRPDHAGASATRRTQVPNGSLEPIRGPSPTLLRLAALLTLLLASQAMAQLPSFLQVGSRLTWHAGGSSLQGSRFVPDPNGWVWQNEQWNRLESTYGGGGVGYLQLNVLAAGPDAVVGDLRNYLNTDLQAGIHVLSGVDVVMGNANGLGEYWLPPARLATVQPGFDGLTRVWRGPRVIEGRSFDTVSIATITGASYRSHTYDLASGLLLFGGSMDSQAGTMVTDDRGNPLFQGRGTVSYTHMLFMGVRQLQVPWADRAPPDWANAGLSLVYQGQSRVEFAQAGGLPPLGGQAMSVSYAFDRRVGNAIVGRQWTHAATTQGLPPSEVVNGRAFGSAMFDGLWVAPDVLGQLQANQLLDQDPFTGLRVFFGGVQGSYALLVSQGPGDSLEQYYDLSSGFLTYTRYLRAAANVGTQINELQYAGPR